MKYNSRRYGMEYNLKGFNELTADEVYEIVRVRNEVFVVEQNCVYQDCDGKDRNSYHLYCMNEGKIVAYVRVLEKGVSYDEISIGRVLVAKEHRGKGLARECMKRAIDFVKNDLCEYSIRISAQEYLREFYGSLGFEEVSEVYLEDDIPHIEMLYKK